MPRVCNLSFWTKSAGSRITFSLIVVIKGAISRHTNYNEFQVEIAGYEFFAENEAVNTSVMSGKGSFMDPVPFRARDPGASAIAAV